jgi:plasmid stabilization system protein ParE
LKVFWSPLALEKLEVTAKFIALDKPSAAEKWVNDIFDRTDLLDFDRLLDMVRTAVNISSDAVASTIVAKK